ncbi:MAG: cytochrome b/b6 domain-containing protein [Betaproteobacteria bacterium]|nr:cytochrome b/b6 domain-containing protein [Betaproteobacteria bacterium]
MAAPETFDRPAESTAQAHPLTVRITHWINAVAILVMILSGWRIYNASPLLDFKFPRDLTLGGWLGGALQWHFAAMWLLALNGIVYLVYGFISGHFRRDFLPVTVTAILRDIGEALRGKLPHELGVYNAVQRTAYLSVIVLGVILILSGLAIWKPVQLQELAALFGGYEGARWVHFLAMVVLCLFVLVHVIMVMLVPKTFLPMWTGRAPPGPRESNEEKPA